MNRSLTAAVLILAVAGCSPAGSVPAASSRGAGATPTSTATPSARIIDATFDVEGQRLHLQCRGTGSPTVVLEAGLNNDASVWDRVFVTVSLKHRACRYDRPGLGTSVPLATPATGSARVEQLRALLTEAEVSPPFVLVGASFGGLLAQLHARSHPDEVAAVVLVDSTHPELDARIEELLSQPQRAERRMTLAANDEGLTFAALEAIDREVEAAGPFPPLPLVVLQHGQPFDPSPGWPNDKVEALWASLQQELAALSPTSEALVASRSQHRIAQSEPELVATAIDWSIAPTGHIALPSSAPVLGADAQLPVAEPQVGLIAFVRDGKLAVMNADGSDLTVIVEDRTHAVGTTRISPDGTRVAYIRAPRAGPEPGQEPQTELVVASIDGGDSHVIASSPGMNGLDWAPDGRNLAFSSHGKILLVASSGGATSELVEGGCPLWAPDGAHLAICDADDEITIVDTATRATTVITDSPGIDEPRAWSPDGSRLAIYSERDGNGEAYVIGADGDDAVRITNSPGSQMVDAWLVSDEIVIASFPPDSDDLYWVLTTLDGGSAHALTVLRDAGEPIDWHQRRV